MDSSLIFDKDAEKFLEFALKNLKLQQNSEELKELGQRILAKANRNYFTVIQGVIHLAKEESFDTFKTEAEQIQEALSTLVLEYGLTKAFCFLQCL